MNVLETLQWFSRQAEAYLSSQREGARIHCEAGCHACCYEWVACTVPEAVMVARRLVSEGRGADALSRIDQYVERTMGIGDQNAHWRAHVPCPFLSDGLCSIYDYRPVACRQHFSFDREACHSSEYGTKVPYWEKAMEAGYDLQVALIRACPGSSAARLPVDFVRGVRTAIKRPAALVEIRRGYDPFRSARLKALRILEDHDMSAQEINRRAELVDVMSVRGPGGTVTTGD